MEVEVVPVCTGFFTGALGATKWRKQKFFDHKTTIFECNSTKQIYSSGISLPNILHIYILVNLFIPDDMNLVMTNTPLVDRMY